MAETVVVTGVSARLGRAIAVEFARDGAQERSYREDNRDEKGLPPTWKPRVAKR